MFIIIGAVVVLASIIIGFTMVGGQIGALIQINEYIVIVGAAVGSLLISAPLPVVKKIVGDRKSVV